MSRTQKTLTKLRDVLEADIGGRLFEALGPALEVAGAVFVGALVVIAIVAATSPWLLALLWIGMGR